MDDFLGMLYSGYIVPYVEDEETLHCASELYRDLPESYGIRCERLLRRYAVRAFLLGVRTGVKLGD